MTVWSAAFLNFVPWQNRGFVLRCFSAVSVEEKMYRKTSGIFLRNIMGFYVLPVLTVKEMPEGFLLLQCIPCGT